MSDKIESALEITSDDVSVNEKGGVEITNPRLAEAIKTALTSPGAMRAATNTGCGNNLYQCKPAKELATLKGISKT